MAALGTLRAKLLLQVGEATPHEIGTIEIPIRAHSPIHGGGVGSLDIPGHEIRKGMARAMRESADELDPPDASVEEASS